VRRIVELIGSELEWVRTRTLFRMEYELRSGDETVAVLRFQTIGSIATAECSDGCWTFERVGFWRNKTVVRACGEKTSLGLFKENKWVEGGTLELIGGRRYIATTNRWCTQYEIRDNEGAPVIRLSRSGLVRQSVSVTIHSKITNLQELPWLAMLAYYQMVMMDVDAANS
jgi:hypothetical protein